MCFFCKNIDLFPDIFSEVLCETPTDMLHKCGTAGFVCVWYSWVLVTDVNPNHIVLVQHDADVLSHLHVFCPFFP